MKDFKNYNKGGMPKEETGEASPAKVETNGPETKNGIVVGSMYVKVRKEPRKDEDNVLEILRQGDRVTILGSARGFYKVETNVNRLGFISKDFVKEE